MSIVSPAPMPETPPARPDGRATLSFVLGLVSLVINPIWATSIVGGIFGIAVLTKPHDGDTRRKAVLGIVFSAIGLFTSAALLALTILAISGIATGAKSVSAGGPASTAKRSFSTLTDFKDALVKAGYSCPDFKQAPSDNHMTGSTASGSCSDADVLSIWSDAAAAKQQATNYPYASTYLIYGGNWILNTSDPSGTLALSALGGTTVDQSTDPSDSAAPEDDSFSYEDAGLEVSLKTKSKQCFGSAGCNLVVSVNVAVDDTDLIPDSASGEVTYTITGDESGPIIGTIDLSGTSYSVPQESLSTASSGTKVKVKVTDIETD